ncbi:MAG: DUF1801 domain-containing protein [Polyangiaceae bacterium]
MNAPRPNAIDDYIARFPRDVQKHLRQVRAAIKKAAPGAEETVKYQIPTFVLGENLVHFAGYEHHVGFYPTPSAIVEFKRELSRYESAKGSVRFPLDEPMPLALITKIVKFRVAAVKLKFAAKPARASAEKATRTTAKPARASAKKSAKAKAGAVARSAASRAAASKRRAKSTKKAAKRTARRA